MRQIHKNVYQDANGHLVMIENENPFTDKKKITDLTALAGGAVNG